MKDMSRVFKTDFDELLTFIKDYSVASLCGDDNFVKFLSTIHKKFYVYLVLIEEMRKCVDDKSKQPELNGNQFAYLQESVSDCGQSLFLCVNGCYKGARLLLRSSIENLLKGISLDDVPQILTEKSVYQVFDDANQTEVFKGTNIVAELYDIYGLLCQDVHTTDPSHMIGVKSLNFFPHFVSDEAKKIEKVFIRLIPLFVTALCIKYYVIYHAIDWTHKELIVTAQIDTYKAMINGE